MTGEQTQEEKQKIKDLFIMPPNSTIPELSRFHMAPYKFSKLFVEYDNFDFVHDIVFYNENAIISTLEKLIIFKTKEGRYYKLELRSSDFPAELHYYVYESSARVEYAKNFSDLVERWKNKYFPFKQVEDC
ncbi:MAG: hypothetical protein QXL51_06220 [Candidatus Aenigmatarchaeota archaeon]